MGNRPKMDRTERAKQFMPFAALKGYEEALREKERIVVPKIELSEEMKEELDFIMQDIQKNDMIKVIYFQKDEYLQVTGLVSGLDKDAGILKVVNTKIVFANILKIEKIK